MQSRLLPYLLGLSALCLSGVSAYFSIFGLSKLFAGAGVSILVMAGVMEVSKIVLTVYLHRFWEVLFLPFRVYLVISVVALVVITTMGGYGFLSAGFQTSITKLENFQTGERFLQDRIDFFNEEIELFNRDLDRVSETISTLSGVQSTNIQVRDTTVAGGVRNTISTVDVRMAQERLEIERQNRQEILNNRQTSIDSLQVYRQRLLEAQSGNDISSEIGPLQYLAELTGRPITEVVNILIVILILVLDPLAISMILASSIGLYKLKESSTEKKKEEVVETRQEQPKPVENIDVEKGLPVVENTTPMPPIVPPKMSPTIQQPVKLKPSPTVEKQEPLNIPPLEETPELPNSLSPEQKYNEELEKLQPTKQKKKK